MSIARLETLIWVLIFAGLLMLGLGLSVRHGQSDAVDVGLGIAVVGAALATIGVVLIYVRSRIHDNV